jgi:quercetin dioxygenase-like cupin family protein
VVVRHVPAADIPKDRSAVEGTGFTASYGEVSGDSAQGSGVWHHHGDHHIVAYLIDGEVRVESGTGGGDSVTVRPGDMVHIEPQTVHREFYTGDIRIVGFSVGSGPGRIDVEESGR